jgi:hypothetical protein
MTSRTAALNRLLQLHYRSLPMYLSNTRPWARRNHDAAREVMAQIVSDQERMFERIYDALAAAEAEIGYGEFPMDYTSLHDLSLDWLLERVVAQQRRMVAQIEHLAGQQPGEPLIAEALGLARGHLELLGELVGQQAA